MRIALIYPTPVYNYDLTTKEHIGICYIAANLEKFGHIVDVLYYSIENDSVKEYSSSLLKYDMIGFSTYYYNFEVVLHLVIYLKKLKSNAFIFWGGYLPTLSFQDMEKELKLVNCFVIGEGEITCCELADNLQKGDELWKNTLGIVYHDGKKLIHTGNRPLIKKLDSLPFPKRTSRKVMSFITSRGCYGHCNFCGISEFYMKCDGHVGMVRKRSAKNVVDELEVLYKIYGAKKIEFNDDNFAVSSESDKVWFDEFYSEIKKRNINLEYSINIRVNEIIYGKDRIEAFKEIGLKEVFVGVESFIQRQLDFFNKNVKAEQNVMAIKILQDEIKVNFVCGLLIFEPNVVIDEILEYIDILQKISINKFYYDTCQLVSMNCTTFSIPGTPLYDFVIKNNLYTQNKLGYKFINEETADCHKIIMKWVDEVLEQFCSKLYLLSKCEERGDLETYQEIKNIFNTLFDYDLSFIRNSCLYVKEQKRIEDFNIYEMLDLWGININNMKKRLLDIEKMLGGGATL